MARNPVQFQKGISLTEFLSLYGTVDQCFDALYQWRWPNGFLCPHCGHDRCCQLNSRKLQQCNRCHRQTSITAGTIFDSTKLALTLWFQAIYLMTQDKKGVSAMKLHRHLGISYNAAWRMRHKLMQVMMERDRVRPRRHCTNPRALPRPSVIGHPRPRALRASGQARSCV